MIPQPSVAWNQPWWEFLYHKNLQMLQTGSFSSPREFIYQHTTAHSFFANGWENTYIQVDKTKIAEYDSCWLSVEDMWSCIVLIEESAAFLRRLMCNILGSAGEDSLCGSHSAALPLEPKAATDST